MYLSHFALRGLTIACVALSCGTPPASGLPTGRAESQPAPATVAAAERLAKVQEAFAAGDNAMSELGPEQTPAQCSQLPPLVRPFCYEGAAAAAFAIGEHPPAEFEERLADLDQHYQYLHCLGAGFGTATHDPNEVASATKDLSELCQRAFWDGYSFFLMADKNLKTTEPCRSGTAQQCEEAQGKIVAPNEFCDEALPGNRQLCAIGSGRSLTFMTAGDLGAAMAGCGDGDLRSSCVVGVALASAFTRIDELPTLLWAARGMGADRDAFERGLGSALCWREKSTPDLLRDTWLSKLRLFERAAADRLLGEAKARPPTDPDAYCAYPPN